jgi:hypothetical protein
LRALTSSSAFVAAGFALVPVAGGDSDLSPVQAEVSMATHEDVESYLIRMEAQFEEVNPGVWLVKPEGGGHHLIVGLAGPVVVFRLKLMDLPAANREELYRTLLEINASEMVHGAYGVEDNAVVISDAMQAENLDFNELQSAVDDILLAAARDYARLSKFRDAA